MKEWEGGGTEIEKKGGGGGGGERERDGLHDRKWKKEGDLVSSPQLIHHEPVIKCRLTVHNDVKIFLYSLKFLSNDKI